MDTVAQDRGNRRARGIFRWENLLVAAFLCYLVYMATQCGFALHWPAKAERFADQRFAGGKLSGKYDFDSLGAHLRSMQLITGKRVLTPPDFAGFLAKYEEDASFSANMMFSRPALNTPDQRVRAALGVSYAEPVGLGRYSPRTIGEYLDWDAARLGMTWNYDAAHDVVALDFPWHKVDSRPASALAAALAENFDSTGPTDAIRWQKDFDALLSDPANFPQAWKVRTLADRQNASTYRQAFVLNAYTGFLPDENGALHLVVLNIHRSEISGGFYTMSFYLFDHNGKFEQAGIYEAGSDRDSNRGIASDPAKKRLIQRYGSTELDFAVEKSRLVLREHLENGTPVKTDDAPAGDPGRMLLTVDGE